ncbi:MAG: response regulator, partial [Ignavibacteriae bacterium]|nr:response regulator [Ignavibacteriota bacterium]
QILSEYLAMKGYQSFLFRDGNEGLSAFKAQTYDCCLLDVMMPKMDGFEVCKALSSNDKTRLTPIIMVTALNSTSDIEKGFEAGAFDYIKKPFNRVELLARIKAALRFNETNKLYLELEKINTFSSTVKKTNHEIKQPLTLINLSVTALKRELDSVVFDKNSAVKRIEFIESAVKDILNVMSSMLNIKEPEVKEFLDNLKANQFKIGAETQSLEQPL